ncbi:TraR/DksA family transcriptional regulator [Nocardioides ochotonae]|uniref:TraR/DksA family transcriptional regulator n=1 Tax=Nocardioides ochotonae TaxID=2685869 RepID=UPI001FB69CFC|nr:TraR/DksA C4-type zinc finger protein [Nocardioides ochotonae]
MARSTPKSLASQAATAARQAMGRRTPRPAETEAPVEVTRPPARRSGARTLAAKGASPAVTTASTTKARVRGATKKAAAAEAPGSAEVSAPAKKAPAKKAAAKKAPAKKTAAKKAPAATSAGAKPAARKAATTPARRAAVRRPVRQAPAALVVKAGEAAWTRTELKEVVEELRDQRTHLEEMVHDQEVELTALLRDSGDGAGHDQADVGAASFERDHEFTVLRNERDKLAQIEHALGRIDDGTYGVCEACGEPIGKMRLMAFPRATLCMTCKQREERR